MMIPSGPIGRPSLKLKEGCDLLNFISILMSAAPFTVIQNVSKFSVY